MNRTEEIRLICDRLREAWQMVPQLRLGQLIVNVMPRGLGNDPYYFEDQKMIEAIEKLVYGPWNGGQS